MISHDGISFNPPTSSSSINGFPQENSFSTPNPNPNPDTNVNKRKRSLPGNPDPEADVIALSPRSLMATNRFICEVCNKGFQREQNLQLHRRGHNLPWKLKQKSNKEPVRKKVYICPEKSCVHHDASRALGDLTGIKKHYSRKHGEKKWKCDKCSKKYAVMSDWKAHSKICGTREYKCDCGTIFSRKDSFITHRAFCDALAEERMRVNTSINPSVLNQNFRANFMNGPLISTPQSIAGVSPFSTSHRPEFVGFEHAPSNANNIVDHLNKPRLPIWLDHHSTNSQVMDNHIDLSSNNNNNASNSFFAGFSIPQETIPKEESNGNKSSYPQSLISLYSSQPLPCSPSQGSMSATALLQKAAQIGSTRSDSSSTVFANAFGAMRPSSSSTTPSNNPTNYEGGLHQQKHLYGQHSMSNQLGIEQGYSETEQLMMMGEALSESSNKMSSSAGMRDFLGTLGGVAGNNNAWS